MIFSHHQSFYREWIRNSIGIDQIDPSLRMPVWKYLIGELWEAVAQEMCLRRKFIWSLYKENLTTNEMDIFFKKRVLWHLLFVISPCEPLLLLRKKSVVIFGISDFGWQTICCQNWSCFWQILSNLDLSHLVVWDKLLLVFPQKWAHILVLVIARILQMKFVNIICDGDNLISTMMLR